MTVTNKLIELSKIFKEGFTVEIKNGEIQQYSDTFKPYVVSYSTIIEIHNNNVKFKCNIVNTAYALIGGWMDKNTNTYYIEFNRAFKSMVEALKFAYEHKQQHIYDMSTQKAIEVKPWENKITKWLHA